MEINKLSVSVLDIYVLLFPFFRGLDWGVAQLPFPLKPSEIIIEKLMEKKDEEI
jgi:hypothetical protein